MKSPQQKEALGRYHKEYYQKNRDRLLAQSHKRYQENKGHISQVCREYRRSLSGRIATQMRTYGIGPEAAAALLAETRCAICGVAGAELHTDHNHSTGQVRGRLCMRCNRAIGAFRDDPSVLMSAANYLLVRDEDYPATATDARSRVLC